MALDDDEDENSRSYPADFGKEMYEDGKTQKSPILLKTEKFVQALDKVPFKTEEVAVSPAINKVVLRKGRKLVCTFPISFATVLY